MPVAQDYTKVALRMPGVVILSEAQAQVYLETKKIEAEKKISDENNAQRAHELAKMKMQHEHELAKMQCQFKVPTTDSNEKSPRRNTGAAAASAAPTPGRSNAPRAAKRSRNATTAPSGGGGTQPLIRDFIAALLNRNSDV